MISGDADDSSDSAIVSSLRRLGNWSVTCRSMATCFSDEPLCSAASRSSNREELSAFCTIAVRKIAAWAQLPAAGASSPSPLGAGSEPSQLELDNLRRISVECLPNFNVR